MHTTEVDRVVELFGGPGGWAEALRRRWPALHHIEVGLEWNRDACRTRRAAGHRTIRADVAT